MIDNLSDPMGAMLQRHMKAIKRAASAEGLNVTDAEILSQAAALAAASLSRPETHMQERAARQSASKRWVEQTRLRRNRRKS